MPSIRQNAPGAISRSQQSQSLLANNTQPTVVQPSTGISKRQPISDLITHIAKSDNHLWQALISLQQQTNALQNSVTNWQAWDVQIVQQTGQVLPTADIAAYYMTFSNILFVQLNCQQLTFPSGNTTALQLLLPMSIGRIVIQTCSAYINATPVNINDVTMVEAYDNIIDIYLRPIAGIVTYPLALGGSFLIFQ